MQIPLGEFRSVSLFVEICVATIGVCIFRALSYWGCTFFIERRGNMKYCGHCGKQIDSAADVCIYCKTPCNREVFTDQKNKKPDKGFSAFAIIVLILVIVCIAAYFVSEYLFYDNLFSMF